MTKFSIDTLKPGYSVYFPFGSKESVYIQPTANGWWADQAKVNQFLSLIGIDCTIEEACAHSGITLKQYKYFVHLHPGFRELKNAYAVILTLKARQSIMKEMDRGSYKAVIWYLERKHPEEFSLPTIRKNIGLKKWEEQNNRNNQLTQDQKDNLDRIANMGRIKEED